MDASKKLPSIVILRGGKERHEASLKEGASLLSLIRARGYNPTDIYIDEFGVWHNKGLPVEMHNIFSDADFYIDLTTVMPAHAGEKEFSHHDLAKRMGITRIFDFSKYSYLHDRENVYRILRQHNILVPDTYVIRIKDDLSISKLQEFWKKIYTPYIVRYFNKKHNSPSILVKSFDEFKNTVEKFKEEREDILVMTYRNFPPYSIAVLPEYRGEKLYTPLAVQTLSQNYDLPNDEHTKALCMHLHQNDKQEISNLAKRTHEALGLNSHVLVDMVKTPKGYMVVEVQINPSLKEESRFSQSLATTGVDVGHYICSRYLDSEKINN